MYESYNKRIHTKKNPNAGYNYTGGGEGLKEGTCMIYCPHTTAGITINENADPSVRQDILNHLEKLVPFKGNYSHLEGNADAHIKTSIIGSSATVIVSDGRLMLGTWQGIFFCEFDGPRQRKVFLQLIPVH